MITREQLEAEIARLNAELNLLRDETISLRTEAACWKHTSAEFERRWREATTHEKQNIVTTSGYSSVITHEKVAA